MSSIASFFLLFFAHCTCVFLRLLLIVTEVTIGGQHWRAIAFSGSLLCLVVFCYWLCLVYWLIIECVCYVYLLCKLKLLLLLCLIWKYGIPYRLTFCSLKNSSFRRHLKTTTFSQPILPPSTHPNAPWFSSETLALYKSLTYLLTYLTGAYLLSISWGNYQIPGSPFKVSVGCCNDASKVTVSCEGLECAQLGQDVCVIVDARRAGSGTALTCVWDIFPLDHIPTDIFALEHYEQFPLLTFPAIFCKHRTFPMLSVCQCKLPPETKKPNPLIILLHILWQSRR